ncbi:MAG: chemotaxis protein CheW [Phenylobacterium sp.]|uniref:chemotaxis protein CheW n=1 Tax=Phenylobacterium sp. TaxID=1871053 RepID=UPI0027353A7A|nr:chemotaxis protein CheW [Phenylobacterium sp.]MDP3173213.1 chemotaxis protein CheW [Phenylobacterium sp.]
MASAEPGRVIRFRAGGRRYALDANHVAEVFRRPRVTRVPHAPSSLDGVANLRGAVVPVVALARLLNRPETPTSGERVILLRADEPLGLAVDEVMAVEDAPTPGGMRLVEADGAEPIDLESLLAEAFAGLARRERPDRSVHAVVAAVEVAADVAFLEFRLAGQAYALALDRVREVILSPQDLASLPHADAVGIGVVEHRGGLLPIVSLHALLGLAAATPQAGARVVVAAIGEASVGLLVDEVRAILRTPQDMVGAVPTVLNRGAGEASIDAIVRAPHGLVAILTSERIFREETVARLLAEGRQETSAMSAQDAEDAEQFVVFRLGAERYGLPIAAVDEVMDLPKSLARAPRAPAFVAGVVSHRGEAMPIIDQRPRFGVEGAAPATGRRVVVTTVGGRRAGFIVDAVEDIRRVTASAVREAPQLSSDGGRLFDRVADIDPQGGLMLLVDPGVLLDQAERDVLAAFARRAASNAR